MKKLLILSAAISLSGCATTSALTPCEKAILAKVAAEKVLSHVCPLSGQPENILPEEN